MAVQNLEIAVNVKISEALGKLEELQNELEDLADKISEVDARGAEGIDIKTSVDQLDSELAALEGEIQAFEATNSIDIATDVGGADFGGRGAGGGGGAMGVDVMNVLARNVRIISATGGGFGGGGGGGFNFPGGGGTGIGGGGDTDIEIDGPNIAGALTSGRRDGFGNIFKMARRRISGMLDEMGEFKLRMSDLHNLMASLVPLLITFIGAIPAAITALITLAGAALAAAAAFVAIAGFGAMGFAMEGGQFDAQKLQDVMADIRDDFIEAFGPLAERLQPLFEDALDGLEMFFQEIANQGDALVALTDEARAFGRFLTEFVPSALRTLAGLVEALAPVFGELGDFLKNNFNSIVKEFLEITLESLPALISLAQNLMGVLRFLARLGIGFAAVSSAVLEFLGSLSLIINALGITDAQLGVLLGGLFTFISALAIANFLMQSFVVEALASAIIGMWSFFVALLSADSALAFLSSTTIVSAIGSMWSFIVAVLAGDVSLLSMAASAFTATGALAALLTVASLGVLAGLAAVALGVASSFLGVADSIDSATSSMRDFNRVSGRAGGEGFNPFGGAPDSGAGQTGSTTGTGGSGGGGTTINVESSGDKEQDKSNVQKMQWYQGRNSGNRA